MKYKETQRAKKRSIQIEDEFVKSIPLSYSEKMDDITKFILRREIPFKTQKTILQSSTKDFSNLLKRTNKILHEEKKRKKMKSGEQGETYNRFEPKFWEKSEQRDSLLLWNFLLISCFERYRYWWISSS